MAAGKGKYRLKGHESFILREGWVTKGLFAVRDNPGLFMESYGADELGVGANMAKAIRYWLRAMGLSEERGRALVLLSPMGVKLLEYDAYLEDMFSLWLLHCRLACNFEQATSWYLFFNGYDRVKFDRGGLEGDMEELMKGRLQVEIPQSSLRGDCDAILRMYAGKRPEGADPEEKKGSPFYRLGLVREREGWFCREQPDEKALDPLIVLYVLQGCLEPGQDYYSVSCRRLLRGEKSPGRVLQMKHSFLMHCLEELERRGYLSLNRTAGLDMVYQQHMYTCEEILDEHFGGK